MVRRPDPRITPPLSQNEALFDLAIRRAISVERFKAGEARRIVSFLERKLYPDLLGKAVRRLESIKLRGFDRGPHTTQKVRDMLRALDALVDKRVREAHGLLRASLVDFAAAESQWQAGVIAGSGPLRLETLLPSREVLRSAVVARPFQGRLLREWFQGHSDNTKRAIRDHVRIGIVEGETAAQIARRVRQVTKQSRRGAEAMVRTAVSHTMAHARDATYRANARLLKGWQFVATLDSRTTPVCQALDGTVHEIGRGPAPPRHIACRSSSVPIIKSWRELGIDAKDLAPGTRASMNGQVPASMTYGDWIKRQTVDVQNDALGVRRAQLLRSGGLTVDRFVDRAGRTLTLDELASRHPEAFE